MSLSVVLENDQYRGNRKKTVEIVKKRDSQSMQGQHKVVKKEDLHLIHDGKEKLKTEFCRFGVACREGANCPFAHGLDDPDLAPWIRDNYKTKMCKYDPLICPRGVACRFAHYREELRVVNMSESGKMLHINRLHNRPAGPP